LEKSNELEQKPGIESVQKSQVQTEEIKTANVTPVYDRGGGYVEFEERLFQRDALKELRPDLFSLKGSMGVQSNSNFGTQFPKIASKGDIFVRVDVLPNRVFKFDGIKWLEQNKNLTQSYMDNDYIEFLIEKLNTGEYDMEQLSENEKSIIEAHLKGDQNS